MSYRKKHIVLKKLETFIINYTNRRETLKPEHNKVEFYLMDTFEIYHFLPIYNALINKGVNANFVCEPPEINTVKKWFDYDNAKNILENLGVNYTEKADKYSRIVFSTQQASTLSKYYGIKINLNYGRGFNKTNFGNTPESSKGFDYKFVHGKYMAKNAQKALSLNRIKIIGYPKHDKFFTNKKTADEVKNKLKITTDKPILVYFPTWDNDSSIKLFGQEIAKLKEDFYIVTKAHHCTFRLQEKRDDLEMLYKISDKVLEGNSKFSDAVLIADIALIDGKSGSSCEVPYLKPELPIVYLSPRDNLKEYFRPNIFEFGELINQPEQLRNSVLDVYKNDRFIKIRKKQIEYYLGKRDGKSTQRAIKELDKILK